MKNIYKDIYILHIKDKIGVYIHYKNEVIISDHDDFINLCKILMNNYKDSRLRCIINKGIEDYIINRIKNNKVIYYINNKFIHTIKNNKSR